MPRKFFKNFIHFFYITGIIYSFYFYITTPKATDFVRRRLWAMEAWFIFTLYAFFLWVITLTDKEDNFELNAKGITKMMKLREKKLFYLFIIIVSILSIRFIGRL